MAWGLLMIGAAFGVALLLCGAKAMMLIAVGMYLPFDTSSAIFLGGLIKWIVEKLLAGYSEASRQKADETGTLLASGLIAGEAVVGILLAVLFLTGVSSLTHVLTGADQFAWFPAMGGWLALGAFGALVYALVMVPLRKARQ
jgi:uncharacterized oligopeptide transporter (OPT) family protein